MKNVALIPFRGGSKGIIKKNIKLIAGKPLCEWVLCSAVNSDSINEVFVSTDSKEISGVVEDLKLGIEVINRPPEISTDTASTESVMLHFMEKVNFDNLVTIQATSPLLESVHLDQAFEHFVNLSLIHI